MPLSKILDYIKRANGPATDFSHILYGFITALVPDIAVKALMVGTYFIYQTLEWFIRSRRGEHLEREMKELVGDMREFMLGFTLGIITHYGLAAPF